MEEAEEVEEIESLLSSCGGGERVSCAESSVEQETVVAKSFVGSFGGEFDSDGMNGGASTFEGFPDANPSTKEGVTRSGCGQRPHENMILQVRLPDGDLRRRSSCKLFARGRAAPVLTPRASSDRAVEGL